MKVKEYLILKDKNYDELTKSDAIKLWNYKAIIKEQVNEYKKVKEIEKMEEKNGIYNNKLSEKTPSWIICKIGIKVDELPKPNDKGYINIDICRSKDGSYYYPKLNDFQPKKEEEEDITNADKIDVDENIIPF